MVLIVIVLIPFNLLVPVLGGATRARTGRAEIKLSLLLEVVVLMSSGLEGVSVNKVIMN
jgi:hypothetical protein